MPRLPIPGSDDGTWGDLLNEFLEVEHNTDGSHNVALGGDLSGLTTNAQIVAGAVGNTELATDAVTDIKVSSSAAIAQSKIANLTTDLAAKADETITVSGGTSLTGGGDLTANRTLMLVNDAGTPGNSRYYGTDGAGAKGYHALPAGDPAMGGDLSGTASNAQIVAGAIVDADVNASAAIAQSKIANLVTDLAGKLATKNNVVALTDSTNDDFARFNITDDASPSGSWPDRLAFYFNGIRTGYHNEYGELRARPGKNNTVALRAMYFGSGSANIFEVAPSASGTEYFAVSSTAANLTVPLSSTAAITATNLLYTSDKGVANGVATLDGGTKIPVAQLPNAPITKLLPYSFTGTVVVAAGPFRLYNDTGATWTIVGVRASVGTAPTGASILIDININGTTIFTTQGNRPAIAASANTSGNVTNMDVTSVASGEYLTVDIDQIGSTVAGSDLTVQVEVI